jgi:hypothetical protein
VLASFGLAAAPAAQAVEIAAITFDPPFVRADADEPTSVSVQVKVARGSLGSPKLVLEEVLPKRRGREAPRRFAILRDDGSGSDPAAEDGVYHGRGTLSNPVCGVNRLRLSGPGDPLQHRIELPSARTYLAGADLLPLEIMSLRPGDQEVRGIEIEEAGNVLVSLNGEAKSGRETPVPIDVQIDGESVAELPVGTDCRELVIPVSEGSHDVVVTNAGASATTVGFQLRVLADDIVLLPVDLPSSERDRPLRVDARVRAALVPVAGAEVVFAIGDAVRIRPTDEAGFASLELAPEEVPPTEAVLEARVLRAHTSLTREIPVEHEESSPINLALPRRVLLMGAGATVQQDLVIRTTEDAGSYTIELSEPAVDPASGLAVRTESPAGGLSATGAATFVVEQTFEAQEPGIYTVLTTATLSDGASSSKTLRVVVGPEETDQLPTFYAPSASPAMIPSGEERKVVFKAVVAGTATPPDHLSLDELVGVD